MEEYPQLRVAAWRQIPGGVWALGFVSLLMDISSEMIHALLPVYLVAVLGTSAVTVGIIEGSPAAQRQQEGGGDQYGRDQDRDLNTREVPDKDRGFVARNERQHCRETASPTSPIRIQRRMFTYSPFVRISERHQPVKRSPLCTHTHEKGKSVMCQRKLEWRARSC